MERERCVITIVDTLRPANVNLNLQSTEIGDAVYDVAQLLRDNEHVLDWKALYDGLRGGDTCIPAGDNLEICIPHARTNCVNAMVMSAGRSKDGIRLPSSKNRVHYIFVIGVPIAMAAEYLRIIGALARILKNRETEAELRAARNGQEFVQILRERELKL
jgi:mannitol/fructose-specific phosphotransferase system IIA component (Ntr-type)